MSDDSWAMARTQLTSIITGTPHYMEGVLPVASGGGGLLERYSRLFSGSNGIDLGLVFPAMLTLVSGCSQGAYRIPLPISPGVSEDVAMVMQFLAIAPPGGYKSRVISEIQQVFSYADEAGRRVRTDWASQNMDAAIAASGQEGVALDQNRPIWEKVYAGAVCGSSWTGSGTQEGIRRRMIDNGSHRYIITAEADILREIGAYAKDSGSLALFLQTWNQEDVLVDRVHADGLVAENPSLPFVIMVQPIMFSRYTSVDRSGEDNFVGSGFASRLMIRQSSPPILPSDDDYEPYVGGDDGAHEPSVPALLTYTDGQWVDTLTGEVQSLSEMTSLRFQLMENMRKVAVNTSEYRARKGLRHAWMINGAQFTLGVPAPDRPVRHALPVSGTDGASALREVQKIRMALLRAVEGTDHEHVWQPVAARFTSHVLRIAAALTLADDPMSSSVDAGHIMDVTTRIMPWLMDGYREIMNRRELAIESDLLAESALKNPQALDVSTGGVIVRALYRLQTSIGGEDGFTSYDICRRAGRSFRESKAKRMVIDQALSAMAEATLSGIDVVDGHPGGLVERTVVSKSGKARYRLTTAGAAVASSEMR